MSPSAGTETNEKQKRTVEAFIPASFHHGLLLHEDLNYSSTSVRTIIQLHAPVRLHSSTPGVTLFVLLLVCLPVCSHQQCERALITAECHFRAHSSLTLKALSPHSVASHPRRTFASPLDMVKQHRGTGPSQPLAKETFNLNRDSKPGHFSKIVFNATL